MSGLRRLSVQDNVPVRYVGRHYTVTVPSNIVAFNWLGHMCHFRDNM